MSAMSRELFCDMEKVRVLAVLSGLSAGGAETMYINLFRKLNKEKFSVDFCSFVFCSKYGDFRNFFR